MLGLPVRVVPGDAAVTGVAMLAGIGAGVYDGVSEAIGRPSTSVGDEPDAATRERYEAAYVRIPGAGPSTVARRR